jgi:hypothetical protein
MDHLNPTHNEPAAENSKQRPLLTRFGHAKRRVETRPAFPMRPDATETEAAAMNDDDPLFEDRRGL